MKTILPLIIILVTASALFAQSTNGSMSVMTDSRWAQYPYISSSVNNHVNVVTVSGSDVYVGGQFTEAGTNPANYIARWDGNEWYALGSGVNGEVHSIVVLGSDVFVGGNFTQAGGLTVNRIARWDGTEWFPLGAGFNSVVYALAVSENGLYAGGTFFDSAEQPGSGVSFWDGNAWNALGSGTSQVFALALMGDDLYAGGAFTFVDGEPANRIAKWDGENWTPLATGLNDEVRSLLVNGSDLYAGGRFTRADNIISFYVARWDGENWHQYSPQISGQGVRSLALWNNELYIGGEIFMASGHFVNNFARWDADLGAWAATGTGVNRQINSMAVSNEGLIAGGWFTRGSHYVAQFDGTDWQGMNSGDAAGISGFNGYVRSVISIGSDLYVAGRLTGAGNHMANHVARWDGQQWHALGEGMNGEVSALLAFNGELYAGGSFSMAGGISTGGIARWDGEQWNALASANPTSVFALEEWNGDLYAAGGFRNFGGSVYNKIARWDGTEWHELSGGVDPGQFDFGQVHVLMASGSQLYVGGSFTTAGGQPASRLATWSGTQWAEVTSELNNTVFALAEWGGNLYMAGEFTQPGNRIAGFIEGEWNGLNGGMSERTFALYPTDDALYAGGIFGMAGNQHTSNVASWDGNEWKALASGVAGRVSVFGMYNNQLLVGGPFIAAGGKPSNFLASWSLQDITELVLLQPENEEKDVMTNVTLSWQAVTDAGSYDLDLATDADFDNIVSPVRDITTTSVSYTSDPLDQNTQYWWRVRAVVDGAPGAWSEKWTFTTGVFTHIPEYINLPKQLRLDQNYPNPFNPSTVIRFGLPVQDDVRLEIYSLTGQLVALLVNENRNAGWHQVNFDASALASGIYFYRIQTSQQVISKKLTLIK